jgi:23S rRNA U2552 (ribose-2'-O)-methylase RlmE/FtsJ
MAPPLSSSFRCRAAEKLLEIDDAFQLFHDPRRVRVVLDLAAAPGSFSQVAVDGMLRASDAFAATTSSGKLSRAMDPVVIAVDLQRIHPISHCHILRCNILDHARIRRETHRVLAAERRRVTDRHPIGFDEASQLLHSPQIVLHDGVSVVDGQHELSVTYAQSNMAMGALRLATDMFHAEMRRQFGPQDQRDRCDGQNDARDRSVYLEQTRTTVPASFSFVTKLMPSVHFNAVLQQARRCFRSVDVVRPRACREDSREQYVVCKGFIRSTSRGGGNRWASRPPLSGGGGWANTASTNGFSLPPNPNDVGGTDGRQVMWHCYGCGTSQLGAHRCTRCCKL